MALNWRILGKGLDGSFVWFDVGYFDTGSPNAIIDQKKFTVPASTTKDQVVDQFKAYGRILRSQSDLVVQLDVGSTGGLA